MLAKLLVLFSGLAGVALAYVRVSRRFRGRPDASAWTGSLLMPAAVIILSLAMNAVAFIHERHTAWEIDFYAEVLEPDGTFRTQAPSRWSLVLEQLGVLLGTASLYGVVLGALGREIPESDDPRTAGLRVQVAMYRGLFTEHLLALLGLGTVFGLAGGGGVILLLAAELLLMWAGAALVLRYMARGGAAEGGPQAPA
ncbi:MAG: hypothetical protein M5U26_06210 [Planctomycetota bacterium]|nr:hypothetical protein [Planctomycetota bacterium]